MKKRFLMTLGSALIVLFMLNAASNAESKSRMISLSFADGALLSR